MCPCSLVPVFSAYFAVSPKRRSSEKSGDPERIDAISSKSENTKLPPFFSKTSF